MFCEETYRAVSLESGFLPVNSITIEIQNDSTFNWRFNSRLWRLIMKALISQQLRRIVQLLLCMVWIALLFDAALAQQTALDRYVAKPDPAYSWKLVNTIA